MSEISKISLMFLRKQLDGLAYIVEIMKVLFKLTDNDAELQRFAKYMADADKEDEP